MKPNMPRPHRLRFITEKIRDLKPGEWVLIADAANGSVKSIVSRLKLHQKRKLKYRTFTAEHREGTVVECLK